jgi:hypothetical protein
MYFYKLCKGKTTMGMKLIKKSSSMMKEWQLKKPAGRISPNQQDTFCK